MPKTKEIAKQESTLSSRFIGAITKEFLATAGNIPAKFDEKKKRLAQHLFIQMDAAFTVLEKKRLDKGPKNNPPVVWANVNMSKLAVDAMRRVELGLDALIPNHISVIPYLNGRTKQYDVDLRIGYKGNDYYRRKMAMDEPVDIIYELVHENDMFAVIKRSNNNNVETYHFEIPNPFDRGKVIGGFGYIIFKDHAKNKLVLVSEEDFLASKKYAGTDKFWGPHPNVMRYKTLIHRTTDKLQIDPDKVTSAYATIEAESVSDGLSPEIDLVHDVNSCANKEIIDIEPESKIDDDIPPNLEMSDEEKTEIEEAESAGNTGDGPSW